MEQEKIGGTHPTKVRGESLIGINQVGRIPPGTIELGFHARGAVLKLFRDIMAHHAQIGKTDPVLNIAPPSLRKQIQCAEQRGSDFRQTQSGLLPIPLL